MTQVKECQVKTSSPGFFPLLKVKFHDFCGKLPDALKFLMSQETL